MLEDSAGQKDQTFYWDGNVAAMEEAGQDSYYLQDDLGSPMQLLDENGEIRESYGYDEFGRSLYDYPKEQLQPFGYTGYQVEAAGELYFAQARWYDAGTGRFVGRDKDRYLRFNKPNSLNQYIYCENNPITYIDPRGNSLEDRYSTNPGKNDPVQVKISGNTITIDAYVDITGDINTAVGNYTAHDLVIEGIEMWAGTYSDVFGHTVTVNVNVHEGHKSRGPELSEISDQNYITINLFDGSDRAYTLYNIPWNTSDPGEINMFTEYSNDRGVRDDWDYCNTIAHEFGHILGMNDGYGEDSRPEATELNMYDIMRYSHSELSRITEIDIQMMIMAAITNEEQYFMTYDGYTQSKGATINGACTSE